VDDRNPSGLPQVVDELVNGTVTRTYAYGLSRVSQNQLLGGSRVSSFYGYDGQGSVRFLTNLAGASTDTYQYDAFGNTLGTTGSTPNTFLFSGEKSDSALSLYYFRARYMNPVLGRFMTMDPLPGNIQDPGSLHRYLYARNNAVNRTDPTGLQDLAEYVDILEAIEAYAEIPEKIGKCEYKLLTAVSNALTDAFNGVDVPPNEGPKAAYEFVKCFYEALIPSPEEVAKTVIKEMLGELFEGIDKILYDVLVKLGEELGYF
jgi:RHS repeat-associated protein